MASPGTQAFLKMLEGQSPQAAPVRYSNVRPSYRTPAFPSAPSGIVPPMALPRPASPQSPMLANQQLSPLMQQVLKNAQASRLTPKPGQVGLPTPATAAAGQPAPEMTFGQKLMQPRTQGMLGAAAAGFEASGYQDRPVSLGQVLGRMGTAGMKAYTAAEDRIAAQKAAQAPKIQVAGKDIYRVYPDGRVERLNGGAGASSIEIKSEAGRYITDDGRIIQAVLAKDGKLYEAGNVAPGKELDPSKIEIVDQFTSMNYDALEKYKKDNIIAPERTLKLIDRFAQQIEAGPEGFVQRQKATISSAIKNLSQNTEYDESELMLALQKGTLTQLVGASRLELFGPGVMTEFEQAMAREVLAGNFDNMKKDVALRRLNQFRESFVPTYLDAIDTYNRQPMAKRDKRKVTPYSGFDWSKLDGTSGSGAPAASGNTTTGGNTWSVIR